MMRAALEVRQRCLNHPHRRATRLCVRCKLGLCEDCVRERDGQPICERCDTEIDDLIQLNYVSPMEHVQRFGYSVRNFLIGMVILAAIGVPLSYVVRNLMSTPITPEEFARFRYAASGSFETPEGTMVLSTVLGGKIYSATSEQPGFEAKRLIDEYTGDGFSGWRSADATFPQEVIVEPGQLSRIEKIIVQLHPTEPIDTAPREIEVLVSIASPEGPFQSVGRFNLATTPDAQPFLFPGVNARWVMLRVLSNRGGPYTALGEFDAYILPRNPFGSVEQLTPPAKP